MSAWPPMMAIEWTREGTNGKDGVVVFEEDDAVFFDVLGGCEAFFYVRNTPLRRIVDDA